MVSRLNLKISDTIKLKINKLIFTDSKGNFVIEGEKDKKYWIGFFNQFGSEKSVKIYNEDPLALDGSSGKVNIDYFFYYTITEVKNIIYIVRHLQNKINPAIPKDFYESTTTVDILSAKIANDYQLVLLGNDTYYLSYIGNWINSQYVIIKNIPDKLGNTKKSIYLIYDNNNIPVAKIDYNSTFITKYFPLDDNNYAYINANNEIISKTLVNNNINFTTKLPINLPGNPFVKSVENIIVSDQKINLDLNVQYKEIEGEATYSYKKIHFIIDSKTGNIE